MKTHLLSLLFTLVLGVTSNAQCTITPNCTPAGNGYCTVPANNSTLGATGMVGEPYSFVAQFNTETTYGGAPISGVTVSATMLPPGISVEFNPAGGSSTECFIVGGQAGCVTFYGNPTQAGLGQEIELSLEAIVGGTPVPLTVNYFLDVAPSTASISANSQEQFLTVYPNPSSTFIAIKVNLASEIQITNILGETVQRIFVLDQEQVDVSNWAEGIYFLRDHVSGKSHKFVKN